MTDFTVFRPSRINLTTAVFRLSGENGRLAPLNAENDLTSVLRPVVLRNRSVWIYEKLSGTNCRTKLKNEIVHEHDLSSCTRWQSRSKSTPVAEPASSPVAAAVSTAKGADEAASPATAGAAGGWNATDDGNSLLRAREARVQLFAALTVDRLLKLASELRHRYSRASPFPHIVIDDLFPAEALESLSRELPEAASEQGCAEGFPCYNTKGREYHKSYIGEEKSMGPVTRQFFAFLKSSTWVAFLEALSGISGIVPDPNYSGSGVHMIAPGGMLQVHADFNSRYGLRRRVNTFLYVNPNWPDDFGGHLELWDRNMTGCQQRIRPKLGRFVAFSTTDFSYHGHPQPITAPKGRLRRSLALYYYTSGCPKEECIRNNCQLKHDTLWQRTHKVVCSKASL